MEKQLASHYFIDDPIYMARILVSIGCEYDAAMKRWSGLLRGAGATGNGRQIKATKGRSFLPEDTKDCAVWFPEKPEAGILAHEAMHLSWHILRESGIELSEDSEEAFAYHLGWVVSELSLKVIK